jgi:catabolite regulation protein CreA
MALSNDEINEFNTQYQILIDGCDDPKVKEILCKNKDILIKAVEMFRDSLISIEQLEKAALLRSLRN